MSLTNLSVLGERPATRFIVQGGRWGLCQTLTLHQSPGLRRVNKHPYPPSSVNQRPMNLDGVQVTETRLEEIYASANSGPWYCLTLRVKAEVLGRESLEPTDRLLTSALLDFSRSR